MLSTSSYILLKRPPSTATCCTQPDKALFMYEMAARLTPPGVACAEVHNNMGVIHQERGNPDRAAQCYMAALGLRPDFRQVMIDGSDMGGVPLMGFVCGPYVCPSCMWAGQMGCGAVLHGCAGPEARLPTGD